MRYVCQFSCGAASAVATKLTLIEHPDAVIVNAFIQEEHGDNRRFLVDCERWFGREVTLLRDEKYGASTDEVWRRERFMVSPRGASCSRALKRKLFDAQWQQGDINVIGFTCEERDRFEDLVDHTPTRHFEAPLIERGLDKGDCLAIVKDAGIELPYMYRIGFDNANCIGCPKGGINYWQHIRHHFPARYKAVMAIQEDIGVGAYFLKFRSGPRKGERMSLADLPPGRGNMMDEPSFSCSFACEIAKQENDLAVDKKLAVSR